MYLVSHVPFDRHDIDSPIKKIAIVSLAKENFCCNTDTVTVNLGSPGQIFTVDIVSLSRRVLQNVQYYCVHGNTLCY